MGTKRLKDYAQLLKALCITVGGATVPAYGNWGGQGWSGGWDMKQPPINKMDAAFKRHDENYDGAKTPEDYIRADRQLVAELQAIKKTDLEGSTYYKSIDEDNRYREGAIRLFETKIHAWERMYSGIGSQYLADKMGPDPTHNLFYRATNWVDKPIVQQTLTNIEMGTTGLIGLGISRAVQWLQDLSN